MVRATEDVVSTLTHDRLEAKRGQYITSGGEPRCDGHGLTCDNLTGAQPKAGEPIVNYLHPDGFSFDHSDATGGKPLPLLVGAADSRKVG
ncbi:hypothetical protein ABZ746_09735 [Streptomyces sp. NPDC020096]